MSCASVRTQLTDRTNTSSCYCVLWGLLGTTFVTVSTSLSVLTFNWPCVVTAESPLSVGNTCSESLSVPLWVYNPLPRNFF